MAEDQLLRIKRSSDGDDGIVLTYLVQKGQPQTDLACEAMRAYWLPLALKKQGTKKKELKSIAWESIAQLMKQVELIRLECGLSLDEVPFAHLYGVAPANSEQPASTSIKNVENTDDEVDKEEDIEEDDIDDPYGVDAF